MATHRLNLPLLLPSGPDCERCVTRLQEDLGSVKGVASAAVNNARSAIAISYDPDLVTLSRIEMEARRIGAALAEKIDHATYFLHGLDCPDCAASIERSIRKLPGVLWASANFAAGQIHIESERGRPGPADIVKAIEGHGIRAEAFQRAGQDRAGQRAPGLRTRFRDHRRLFVTLVAVLFMLAGVLAGPLGLDSSGARLLYAIAIVVGGYSTLRAAWMSLRTRSLDMNVLMTLAVAGAAATGEWFEGASVVALFSIGNLLQASAMERTRGTIRGLMELAPRVAHVRRGRGDYDVPVENVPLHETVLVRPGERIPMDGEVIGGSSSVNESSITGESLPAEKGRGDAVYAGTLNQGGALEVMVTRVFRETTLARIIHRVEEAQAQRAPAQLTIDRFARVYTPFVTLLALLVAVGPPASLWTWCALHDATMLPWVWADWFQRGLALLLVACPCALVISTPVAIVTAIGTASRNGVLIKGGAYLEAISDLKVMLYDKTGTLTTGEFELEDIVPLGNESCNRMLMVAAALESRSEHPLAQAFLQSVRRRKLIDLPIVSGFQSLAGFGIEGTIDGQTWRLGCPRLLERAGVSIEAARSVVARVEGLGRTAILLAKETEPTGVFVLADQPREEVKRTIDELRNLGIRRQCMITGDNAGVARSVSAQAGLDEYKACLLPEQKLELVKEFRRQAGPVGMVGDGVNDAPALASAEVGLVMGAAGSDTAMETADVALMGDDLSRLPYLIRLSRKTRSVVRQNIAVSIASKSVLVVAAVFVGIPLWLAVLGDVGVSLLVTLNSLRLSSDRGAACAADSRRALQEARAPA